MVSRCHAAYHKMLRAHKDGIGELPGQTSLELWVKNIVAGLFLLDNTPSYHSNGRMLKLEQRFEILQWMWEVFSIIHMNVLIMSS